MGNTIIMPETIEGSTDGTLNGTTQVEIVPAPGSGFRRVVRNITISNTDTQTNTLTIVFKNGSNERVMWKGQLEVGDVWQFGESGDAAVLDTTSKSIVAFLSSSAATVNPDFFSAYGDVS